MPCHLPERITPELCATIKKHHPVWINTHFNHPDELTPAAVKALGMLADAGIPLGCQTVLLKGVNDTPEVMKSADAPADDGPGAAVLHLHGRPGGRRRALPDHACRPGSEIMQSLRGWTSGLANPHFVIDAPGGGGKIPLLPEYVETMNEEEVVLRNFRGERFVYRQATRRRSAPWAGVIRSGVPLPADAAAEEVAAEEGGARRGSGRQPRTACG